MKLDDVFSNEQAVATSIKRSLPQAMDEFGSAIVNSLVTALQPESSVKGAMDRINASERQRVAALNEAEAAKLKMVKMAEADAESKRLQGEGLANQRKDIATGIRESIATLERSSIDEDEVMTLLLVTQHSDAVQDVARHSRTNTAMLNYSPGGVSDVANQIREAMHTVNATPTGEAGLPRSTH